MKQKKNLDKLSGFRRISLVTTIAIYFLILVGGIVRSTGSGMGCPDWPKCFGSWIPPTSEDQLPPDYKEQYVLQRLDKNERFVSMLRTIGFEKQAQEIEEDVSIREEQPFNATKTWIEYINRLIGAVIGLLILITLVQSIRLWYLDRSFAYWSFLAFVLVLFQGWIGSIVVSTNLLQWMISVHMVIALLIVCLLIFIHYRAYRLTNWASLIRDVSRRNGLTILIGFGGFLMLAQIILGTQVREQVDMVSRDYGYLDRSEWIDLLGIEFLIHRSYSLLLLALHVWFGYWVYKYASANKLIVKWSKVLLILIIVAIGSGAVMSYFGIPALAQPIHLLIGALIIGVQFILWLELRYQKRPLSIKLEK
ncbi:COX15/CtaA family protein [Pleomorphovibrio marinus]|uniref:COX15/CtaA family protein n=1 Tax=Pleomorphovibrio marinus TaxID=2164132 RepID=UPI000E0A85AD|nr:COX15/CtaA family protein [Pleomorphovibrio marinus]